MQFYNLFCPANVVYKATGCIVREKQVKRVVFMILLGFCHEALNLRHAQVNLHIDYYVSLCINIWLEIINTSLIFVMAAHQQTSWTDLLLVNYMFTFPINPSDGSVYM